MVNALDAFVSQIVNADLVIGLIHLWTFTKMYGAKDDEELMDMNEWFHIITYYNHQPGELSDNIYFSFII